MAVTVASAALFLICTTPGGGFAQAPAPGRGGQLECLIDAQSRVKVSAGTAGLIKKIHVDRGARVSAGQLLVEMEASVEEAQLAGALARAENDQPVASAGAAAELARRNDERLRRLRQLNAGAVTDQKLDETRAEVASKEAALKDAQFNLRFARIEADRAAAILALKRIISPTAGVVTERAMSEGEYRHEQAHILTLARVDPLHVEVFAPLRLYGKISVGMNAVVLPEDPVGGRHEAKVIVIDPVIDAASATFGVRLLLPNPDGLIPAGLRCQIDFVGM